MGKKNRRKEKRKKEKKNKEERKIEIDTKNFLGNSFETL